MATLDATNQWRPKLRGKYVIYLRTSAKPHSRLSIKAQRKAVSAFVQGAPAREVGEFIEDEPLVSSSRPSLEQAIACCRRQNATLIFGKLDRMRGCVEWLQRIHELGVRVMAADLPNFCRDEFWKLYNQRNSWRWAMSKSVSDGLARSKAAGKTLGGLRGDPENLRAGPAKSLEVRQAKACHRDLEALEAINSLKERGVSGLSQIARRLNLMGHKAPRGGSWSPTQVRRLIERSAD